MRGTIGANCGDTTESAGDVPEGTSSTIVRNG